MAAEIESDQTMKQVNLPLLEQGEKCRMRHRALAGLALTIAALQLAACAGTPPTAAAAAPAVVSAPAELASTYGIRVEGLHLSAAGSMLDFRYRVLDVQKAAPLLDRKLKPYLLDPKWGAQLGVPDTPVLGQIRQTSRNGAIYTDRTYFIMFGNPGKAVQRGDTVTLVMGQAKITDLKVQ
jgi:hypothetical protein